MKNNSLLFIFITFTSVFQGYSQTSLSKRIDSALSDIANPDEPGVSIGVARGDKFIYSKGFGMADLEMKRKNNPGTPFNVGSNAKQITAACIYLLEEQGKLKTSDKLSKYFKGWPKYADSITINHLIHHESGLMDVFTLSALMKVGDFRDDKSYYQILLDQNHLNFSPGTQSSYSNSGYFLLSLIIRKTSGQDLEIFARQKIFQPLHMDNTSFSRSHLIPAKANGYILANKMYKKENPADTTIGESNLYSTIIDWNKWLVEMKTHKVLGNRIWFEMLKVASSTNPYGGGLDIEKKNDKLIISHGGDLDGYHSRVYYFQQENLGIIIFSNNDNISTDDIYNRIYRVCYKDRPNAKVISKKVIVSRQTNPLLDTTSFIGSYKLRHNFVISVSKKEGFLHAVQLWNRNSYTLLPETNHIFYPATDTSIVFKFKDLDQGETQSLEIHQNGGATAWKRLKLSLNLNDYCGTFFNEELGTKYRFIMKDNVLKLSSAVEPLQFEQLDIDSFMWNYGYIHFTRDKDNVVKEMILDHPRVNKLRFVKVND